MIMLALFDYQLTIPKHRGSCFSFHFPFLQLLIFRPTNLNPLRHRYLALESLMFIPTMVLLFGGFFWSFRSSFSHPCSERCNKIYSAERLQQEDLLACDETLKFAWLKRSFRFLSNQLFCHVSILHKPQIFVTQHG